MTLYLKALRTGRAGTHTDFVWPPPGEVVRVTGRLAPCSHGLHMCRPDQILDWLSDEMWLGDASDRFRHVDHGDKMVVREAALVRRLSWDARIAQLYAADCAERVLHIFERERPGDDRPRLAIEAARAFARDAASAAAGDAARDAAWAAAAVAASAAASAAAWDAASVAAGAAAWAAARDAARAAARDAAGAAAAVAVAVRDAARAAAPAAARAAAWDAAAVAARDAAWAAAAVAAGDAARAAAWAAARDAERKWQIAHLLDVLGVTDEERAGLGVAP